MLTHFGSMLAPFCCHFGAKLAVSSATWPHELALDGLVGLREALRIWFILATMLTDFPRILKDVWFDFKVCSRRVSVHRSASAGSRSEKNSDAFRFRI